MSTWSAEKITFAKGLVRQVSADAVRFLQGFVNGCLHYVGANVGVLISDQKALNSGDQKMQLDRKRWNVDPVVHIGTHARVVVTLSLRGDRVWQQLSSLVVGELADYVQPPTFGVLRIVVPPGQMSGGRFCCAHGDEVYFGDLSHRCLAVYRDDALQRRIGEGELTANGSAVVGDAVFVAEWLADCVCVYPRTGGARLRRFDARGERAGEMLRPLGIAACGGRVYVAGRQVSVFAEDGAFCAHIGGNRFRPGGLAVDANEIFVGGEGGCVRVFRADNGALERRIGGGFLRDTWDVCVSGGVLFASDFARRRVVAFDAATGDVVTTVVGFDGIPYGVAVCANDTLFLTTEDENFELRLYAAQLL